MFRNDRSGHAGSDRTSLYDDITGKIIAELKVDRFPWVHHREIVLADHQIGGFNLP
ncbi:hypothetical protein DFR48_106231 [Ciceribacter lividus]|uniref:Uncharacterized protein n=1 Tax=Ciceribacter lividus TaxID=1197950 RepID=A0A6I7HMD8_9HYPH|nr:hypothetical protein DFR48_106231 [Ciceribacter lividus]